MKPPAFWQSPEALLGRLLTPLGWVYAGGTAWRLAHGEGWRAPIPVICVGNLTAGGSGKTPIVRDLAARLSAQGLRPAILSRGYGGRDRGPLKVDPAIHDAARVGDEPLLLARDTACWVAANRAEGARAIAADGADIILMDDGLQNPDLAQDLRLVVVDGETGFGNGRIIPAGPLREPVQAGMKRAHAMIITGQDKRGLERQFSNHINILKVSTQIRSSHITTGKRLVAFAGIGRPEKFLSSLTLAGANVADFEAFDDHHPYNETELISLSARAAAFDAQLVTTEKDWIRLPAEWRNRIKAIPIDIHWDDETKITALLTMADRHG
jgi:tetraacyldisaccharide 4'-kinase